MSDEGSAAHEHVAAPLPLTRGQQLAERFRARHLEELASPAPPPATTAAPGLFSAAVSAALSARAPITIDPPAPVSSVAIAGPFFSAVTRAAVSSSSGVGPAADARGPPAPPSLYASPPAPAAGGQLVRGRPLLRSSDVGSGAPVSGPRAAPSSSVPQLGGSGVAAPVPQWHWPLSPTLSGGAALSSVVSVSAPDGASKGGAAANSFSAAVAATLSLGGGAAAGMLPPPRNSDSSSSSSVARMPYAAVSTQSAGAPSLGVVNNPSVQGPQPWGWGQSLQVQQLARQPLMQAPSLSAAPPQNPRTTAIGSSGARQEPPRLSSPPALSRTSEVVVAAPSLFAPATLYPRTPAASSTAAAVVEAAAASAAAAARAGGGGFSPQQHHSVRTSSSPSASAAALAAAAAASAATMVASSAAAAAATIPCGDKGGRGRGVLAAWASGETSTALPFATSTSGAAAAAAAAASESALMLSLRESIALTDNLLLQQHQQQRSPSSPRSSVASNSISSVAMEGGQSSPAGDSHSWIVRAGPGGGAPQHFVGGGDNRVSREHLLSPHSRLSALTGALVRGGSGNEPSTSFPSSSPNDKRDGGDGPIEVSLIFSPDAPSSTTPSHHAKPMADASMPSPSPSAFSITMSPDFRRTPTAPVGGDPIPDFDALTANAAFAKNRKPDSSSSLWHLGSPPRASAASQVVRTPSRTDEHMPQHVSAASQVVRTPMRSASRVPAGRANGQPWTSLKQSAAEAGEALRLADKLQELFQSEPDTPGSSSTAAPQGPTCGGGGDAALVSRLESKLAAATGSSASTAAAQAAASSAEDELLAGLTSILAADLKRDMQPRQLQLQRELNRMSPPPSPMRIGFLSAEEPHSRAVAAAHSSKGTSPRFAAPRRSSSGRPRSRACARSQGFDDDEGRSTIRSPSSPAGTTVRWSTAADIERERRERHMGLSPPDRGGRQRSYSSSAEPEAGEAWNLKRASDGAWRVRDGDEGGASAAAAAAAFQLQLAQHHQQQQQHAYMLALMQQQEQQQQLEQQQLEQHQQQQWAADASLSGTLPFFYLSQRDKSFGGEARGGEDSLRESRSPLHFPPPPKTHRARSASPILSRTESPVSPDYSDGSSVMSEPQYAAAAAASSALWRSRAGRISGGGGASLVSFEQRDERRGGSYGLRRELSPAVAPLRRTVALAAPASPPPPPATLPAHRPRVEEEQSPPYPEPRQQWRSEERAQSSVLSPSRSTGGGDERPEWRYLGEASAGGSRRLIHAAGAAANPHSSQGRSGSSNDDVNPYGAQLQGLYGSERRRASSAPRAVAPSFIAPSGPESLLAAAERRALSATKRAMTALAEAAAATHQAAAARGSGGTGATVARAEGGTSAWDEEITAVPAPTTATQPRRGSRGGASSLASGGSSAPAHRRRLGRVLPWEQGASRAGDKPGMMTRHPW